MRKKRQERPPVDLSFSSQNGFCQGRYKNRRAAVSRVLEKPREGSGSKMCKNTTNQVKERAASDAIDRRRSIKQ